MSVFNSTATAIARSYGALTRALAERQNAERIRIAQANFDTTRSQINDQKRQKASELAGIFQSHIGTVRANAAYRGVGGGSVLALETGASAQAEVARRNIDINANNAIGAAAAQSLVPLEDPQLAQLEGTFRGLSMGSEFAAALASLPSSTQRYVEWVQTGLGWQAVNRTREVPAYFNLGEQFPELHAFLRGT